MNIIQIAAAILQKKCASLEAEILMCVLLHISILIFKQKKTCIAAPTVRLYLYI